MKYLSDRGIFAIVKPKGKTHTNSSVRRQKAIDHKQQQLRLPRRQNGRGWPETKEESFATRTPNSNRISVEIQKEIVRSNAGKTNEERVCAFSSLLPLLFPLSPSLLPFSPRDREDYAPAFAQGPC